MYKTYGPIGADRIDVDMAKECLEGATGEIQGKPEVVGNNIRNWIRSETEASMLWSFFSPAIPHGPYFCVDIGAGTTDANVFQITQDNTGNAWVKNGLCFYGAHSIPFAMDALSMCSEEEVSNGYASIREGLIKASQMAYIQLRGNHLTVNQWKKPQIILIGGGSLDPELCESLLPHPMVNWRGEVLEPIDLSAPNDLVRADGSPVRANDVVFSSVAYGLAQIGAAAPETAMPTEVQPVSRHAVGQLLNHEMIYDD